MAYITLLSSVLSFFLIAISADVQDIIVDKYHIDIQLYPEMYLKITSYFVLNNLQKTQEISIYTDSRSILVSKSLIKKDTNVNLAFRTTIHNDTTNTLTFFLMEEMDPGLYVMEITLGIIFDFAFNQVYSDRIHEKEVVWLSSSYVQPIWIQTIIPCWIKPKEDTSWTDMPIFNLSILHPARHSVLTNVAVREERLDEEGLEPDMKRIYFDTTPQMSPYQLSIIVTNFTRTIIDKDDVVSMWCRNRSANSLQFALTLVRNITTYLHLSRWWLPRRFSTRVKLIVIPKIQSSSRGSFPEWNDSLVHPGIIIANEDDVTYNEENDSVGRKYNVIRLIGYKVMQEYYEWIVNPYWEFSTWLSKGFATFIATHNLDQISPNLRMIDLFVVQIQHECLDFDLTNDMLPFSDQNETIPVEIIDNIKVSVMLRMLQHTIISEVFWKTIDMFTFDSIIANKERHLKIFWQDVQNAHDEIRGKYDTEGIYSLKDFIHDYYIRALIYKPWIDQKGYPLLTVKRNYDSSKSEMNISVKYPMNEPRPISLTYTTRTSFNFKQTETPIWLGYKQHKNYTYDYIHKLYLDYKEDSWIIFNIQQTGYYRVNYDNENWARISTYLNEEDYWKIHVLNRAQLIDDAFQLMLLDKLKADIFWQLTKYLERETDYIAWYPMFKAIEYMSTSFKIDYSRRLSSIWPNLDNMLNSLIQNIEHEERITDNDFTKALRQEALHWACSLKMSHCRQYATVKLKLHLASQTKLSPWWKKWTYCYGLIEADNITWHQTLNKMKGNDNDKILYLMTCPNHLVQINNYTSTTYTNDDVKSDITPSTIVQIKLRHFVYTIVESVKSNETYNDKNNDRILSDNKMFKNLLNNFADIKPRQLNLPTAILILINNIYSIDYLNDVTHAFVLKGIPVWHFVFKGIPEIDILKKLQVRTNQIDNHNGLFTRIKPRN